MLKIEDYSDELPPAEPGDSVRLKEDVIAAMSLALVKGGHYFLTGRSLHTVRAVKKDEYGRWCYALDLEDELHFFPADKFDTIVDDRVRSVLLQQMTGPESWAFFGS